MPEGQQWRAPPDAPRGWRERDELAWQSPMYVTVGDYFQGRTLVSGLIVASAACSVVAVVFAATRWQEASAAVAVHWCVFIIAPACISFAVYMVHSFVRVNAVLQDLARPGFDIVRTALPLSLTTSSWPPPSAVHVPQPYHSGGIDVPAVLSTAAACARAACSPGGVLILRVEYSERLGNNVLQYMLARCRARMLGAAFSAPRLGAPFSDADVFVPSRRAGETLSHAADVSLNPMQYRDEAHALYGTTSWRVMRSGAWRASWCAWMLHPASGYIMNTALFAGMEREIKSWLAPSLQRALARQVQDPVGWGDVGISHADAPILSGWKISDVAIHVRLGDILWGHHAAYRPLTMSFYRAALAALPGAGAARRVVLVTEDRTHEIVLRMAAWLLQSGLASHVRLQSSSLTGDFLTLYTAPALICSISSFAWCAAFFGSASKVVIPVYGLLKPQVWFPQPGVPAMHDMSIRDDAWVDSLQLQVGAARRVTRSQQRQQAKADLDAEAVHAVVAAAVGQLCVRDVPVHAAEVVQRAGAPAQLSLAPYVPAPAMQDEHFGALRADDEIERFLEQNASAVRMTTASRIVQLEAPCRWLTRYDGDFRHTLEALFDDDSVP